MNLRTVISMAITSSVDLDKPLLIKLGCFDDRTIEAVSWSIQKDGHLVLTLDDRHDHFPVGRALIDSAKDGVLRTNSEHLKRGGFSIKGEEPGKHLPRPYSSSEADNE